MCFSLTSVVLKASVLGSCSAISIQKKEEDRRGEVEKRRRKRRGEEKRRHGKYEVIVSTYSVFTLSFPSEQGKGLIALRLWKA